MKIVRPAKLLSALVFSWAMAGLWPVGLAFSDGMRCASGRLISEGERMSDVHAKCGDPDVAIRRNVKRTVKQKVKRFVDGLIVEYVEEQEVDIPVDEWTYDLGPRRLVRHVTFEDARVVAVATGGYGVKE